MPADTTAEALRLALQHHQSGRLGEAAALYRRILVTTPGHLDALHLLGVIAHQQGQHERAIELIGKAIARNDAVARFHNNLGEAQRALGRLEPAAASFRRALALDGRYTAPRFNLGNLLLQAGRGDDAEDCFRHALALEPGHALAHNNLGAILLQRGDLAAASACFRRAMELRAGYVDAHNNLGVTLWRQGDPQAALQLHLAATRIDPASVPAYDNLASVYRSLGDIRAACECYRRLLALRSDHPTARLALGDALYHLGEIDEALACYEEAVARRPDDLGARWRATMARLRIVYADTAELEATRARYAEELQALAAACVGGDTSAAADAIGSVHPFYLASLGCDDRALQTTYGELVARLMARRYPQWSSARPRQRRDDEPLRVGIVSGFFYYHSVWKAPLRGWVEHFDRRRIRLFGYHTRLAQDAETERAERLLDRFVRGVRTAAQWAEIIAADALDVILYPEIGQDPTALQLAALRLAPLQCTAFGHPDTSGLPTIDCFLSSALMEPEGAERYYSEQLMRLPNLGFAYAPPERDAQIPSEAERRAARSTLGVPEACALYWCCQAPHKYLPEEDDVFPLIALQVPDARFVFLDLKPRASAVFRRRLDRAFAAHGLSADHHCIFSPPRDRTGFAATTQAADVFLDSIGWSGCNTAFEALAAGLPVVTLPGAFMRGRHAMAILRMAGITETIAASKPEYVAIAARLAREPIWRAEIAARMILGRERVYSDLAPIRALEEVLLERSSSGEHS